MDTDDIDERRKRLSLWELPDNLPHDGGYVIKVKLVREKGGILNREETVSLYNVIGMGDDMLKEARKVWTILEAIHERRSKGDWTV